MTRTHVLKVSRSWWYLLSDGTKTAELRRNDRDFQAGDRIRFDVTDDHGNSLGWTMRAADDWTITHVLPLHMFVPGIEAARFVVLSLKRPDADYYSNRAAQLEAELDRIRRTLAATRGALTRAKKARP